MSLLPKYFIDLCLTGVIQIVNLTFSFKLKIIIKNSWFFFLKIKESVNYYNLEESFTKADSIERGDPLN